MSFPKRSANYQILLLLSILITQLVIPMLIVHSTNRIIRFCYPNRHRKLSGNTAALLATGHLYTAERQRRLDDRSLHLQLWLRWRWYPLHTEANRVESSKSRVHQRHRLLVVRPVCARIAEHCQESDRRSAWVRSERKRSDHRPTSLRLHSELRATQEREHLRAWGWRTVWPGAKLPSKREYYSLITMKRCVGSSIY